jgi:hypothetical protein
MLFTQHLSCNISPIPEANADAKHSNSNSYGTSIMAPQGFPLFEDGDVLIVFYTGRTWKLHSTTLRNCSAVFRH